VRCSTEQWIAAFIQELELKVGLPDYVPDAGNDELPLVAVDPSQAELFRAALNASPSAWGDDGAGDDSSTGDGSLGMGSLLQHIGAGVRGHLAGISSKWEQAHALASDLEQRPILDGQVVRDALKLANTTSRLSVSIDVASKVGGKVSHTADVLSRG
jgi:hypothetical protein